MNERKEPYIPSFGVWGFGAHPCLGEPKQDPASAVDFDENFDKTLKIDDISSIFHFDLQADSGGLDSIPTVQGKYELMSCGDFERMLHEGEVAILHPAMGPSRTWEDNLLDVDFTNKVPELDYEFFEDLDSGNACSESQSPGTSNEAVGVSELLLPARECHDDKLEKTTSSELHEASSSQTSVEDKTGLKCSPTSDLNDFHEVENTEYLLENGMYTDNIKDAKPSQSLNPAVTPSTSKTMQCSKIVPVDEGIDADDIPVEYLDTDNCDLVKKAGTDLRQRRLCKPNQKYTEGWLEMKTRHRRGKKEYPPSSSKHLGVRSHNKHQHKATKAVALVYKESSSRSCIKVPIERQDESSVKVSASLDLDSDEDYIPSPSNIKVRKSNRCTDRRKHNKIWTLSEVEKLVDGISEFGVGKWTAIKSAYFPSYAYRTSLDIRDKWRNLLKTNCKKSDSNKKDGYTRSNGSQPLPKPLLQRVRELATVDPYPRSGLKHKRTSRHDLACPLSQ